ncbi:MAG TPA: gamma-glutamyltransferase, partial [Psychrobacter sp.]|nr:gamma-glutamyltransferase [Psychrobacter sp.]
MSQPLSHQHRITQQKKPKTHNQLKFSAALITSALLLSVSAHAIDPTVSANSPTVNNTSIDTNAINLAIMRDNPTVVSETKRITRAKTTTLTTTSNNANSDQAIYSEDAIHHPVWAKNGMVATQEALASDIGLQILKDGGNAVDAGVAVGFALAVTLPRAGNIGGGGFMMIYDAKQDKTVALDYREKAPSSASRDMYLDDEGNAVSDLSRYHGLAVGVPGTVAGLLKALEEHGTMSREQVMAPAIALAEDG